MYRSIQTLKFLAFSAALFLAILQSSTVSALEPAGGEVLLTVSGKISAVNNGDLAEFDVEMLKNIGTVTLETSTIWTEGAQVFTGVELSDLLAVLGVESGSLRASAVNDYAVDIPVSDAVDGGPIVAFLRNGETMSIRDKGPLWIVYPYDNSTEYQSELIYSRSIWQLDRIEVLP